MSAELHVLRLKLQGALADVPADVLKDATDICQRIGAETEVMPGIPSLEVLAAAAGIMSERERSR
ncbi:hypothetical protein NKJ71_19540 [Mesorhizobium sp. M0050]|uniref:hypothetical protein n=1 Tax=Mesorhizobium sp. M0050 TaxID=2956861 RepID=UPI00333973D7